MFYDRNDSGQYCKISITAKASQKTINNIGKDYEANWEIERAKMHSAEQVGARRSTVLSLPLHLIFLSNGEWLYLVSREGEKEFGH